MVSVDMSLVINSGFDLNESPVFKRVPEEPNRSKTVAREVAWKAEQAGSEKWAEGGGLLNLLTLSLLPAVYVFC